MENKTLSAEEFLAKHKERLERFDRIREETEEEMEEIRLQKEEHPELTDAQLQLDVTNAFIKNNPTQPFIRLDTKKDD